MHSLRISVAAPPVRDLYFTPRRAAGLGAMTVCRLLEKAGHAVSFFNFPLAGRKSRAIPLPAGMEYLDHVLMPQESGPLAFFTGYRHFGPPLAECARQLVADEPDMVLLSSFAFAYADQALELAAEIGKRRPGLPVVAGGAEVSAFPEYYLQDGSIDFALVGEAEIGLVEFVEQCAGGSGDYAGIPGVYAGDGEAGAPERVWTAPEDLEFVWNVALETRRRVHVSTSLSRGCPRPCRFCSNRIAHGRQFRKVPLERVTAGIAQLPNDRPLVLNFEDDNLLLAGEYWLEVLRRCRERLPQVAFRAENGMEHGLLDEGLADELVELGMERFDLSLGSVDAGVLETEQRRVDLDRLERVVRRLAGRGAPVVTYFICGLAGDTVETVLETLLYLAGLPTQVGISLFYPVPGLPGFMERGLFRDGPSARCAGAAAWPWTGALTSAQLVTAFRLARLVNLGRNEVSLPEERGLIERCVREKRLYTLVGKARDVVPAQSVDEDMAAAFFDRLREVWITT